MRDKVVSAKVVSQALAERSPVGSGVVIEAFTELAPDYEGAMDRELRQLWGLGYADLIGRLVEVVPAAGNALILDVATGTAQIPMAMAARSVTATAMIGLDITPAMLAHVSANVRASGCNPRVKLVCASAMDMPFADGTFKVVVCGLGMHHMHAPSVLSEMSRVLKKGGWLVLACVGAPPAWRSSIGSALIRVGALMYSRAQGSARAQAESDAVPNLRTATEWRAMLSDLRFAAIETVATFAARRLWYPGALILKATKSAC
jgi:ubiquinone/menaquinone biosynthesis C-methylase UbiE